MSKQSKSPPQPDSDSDTEESSTAMKGSKYSKFVRNVYEMAMCPEDADAVGFSKDGLCLEIRDVKILTSRVLHRYFKHSNLASFIRQLNNYGFRTVPLSINTTLAHCFAHDCFQKGRKDLLEGVVRKGSSTDAQQRVAQELTALRERANELEERLNQLKQTNDQLAQQKQELLEENKRLKSSWLTARDSFPAWNRPSSSSAAPLDMQQQPQYMLHQGVSEGDYFMPSPSHATAMYYRGQTLHPLHQQQPHPYQLHPPSASAPSTVSSTYPRQLMLAESAASTTSSSRYHPLFAPVDMSVIPPPPPPLSQAASSSASSSTSGEPYPAFAFPLFPDET